MSGNYKVLVAMPAHNEEASIGDVLRNIRSQYPSLDVLVVDDSSQDSTATIAKREGAMVISHEQNSGVAAAIQSSRLYALERNYDFIVFCDADGQHDPSDIGRILDPLLKGEADFVIGSRELGSYVGHESFLLKSARKFCSVVISLLVGKRIRDVTSGFKGWNRKVIEHLKTVYETSDKLHLGTTNDMEEVLLASKIGARIAEVPARMLGREGESEIYTTHNLFRFFTVYPRHLIRMVWRNL
jgi:glycosyltransferase involved in cell wall biosynthesis